MQLERSMMRRVRMLLLGAASFGGFVLGQLAPTHRTLVAPARHDVVEPSRSITAWKEHLEFLTRDGSWWWTTNAEYATDDGVDAFGMRYVPVPGNVASRGCLWGIRAAEHLAVAWHFFQAWDPSANAPFFHQSAPSGAMGMGTGWTLEGDSHTQEQVFLFPDGTTSRVSHRTVRIGPDTMITESQVWAEGQWVPRRSYTWVRRQAALTPCDGDGRAGR